MNEAGGSRIAARASPSHPFTPSPLHPFTLSPAHRRDRGAPGVVQLARHEPQIAGDAVEYAVVARPQRLAERIRWRLDGEDIEHLVADQRRHLVPALRRRQPRELLTGILP